MLLEFFLILRYTCIEKTILIMVKRHSCKYYCMGVFYFI
nr:MAG TPA: hypothetical protein [Caudoviricetes sp.]